MLQRVAHVLLVVALVSAGRTAPFAHIHPQDHPGTHGRHGALGEPGRHHPSEPGATRPHDAAEHQVRHQHPQSLGAHWHPTGRQTAERPGSTTLVGTALRARPVAVATVAVERPGVRAGATPALTTVWVPGGTPVPSSRPVPVATNARPNPPPPAALAARAPPAHARHKSVG